MVTPLLHIGVDAHLLSDFQRLCRSTQSDGHGSDSGESVGETVNRLIGRLLILQHRSQPQTDAREQRAFETVRDYLDAHLGDDVEMRVLPRLAGMKYSRLSSVFRSAVGMTPHQYYLHRKLARAAELLRSGMRVSEVSYSLGFDSPYYFSRIFKEKMGIPPSLVVKNGRR